MQALQKEYIKKGVVWLAIHSTNPFGGNGFCRIRALGIQGWRTRLFRVY